MANTTLAEVINTTTLTSPEVSTAVQASTYNTDPTQTDMTPTALPTAVWSAFQVLHVILTVAVLAANCLSLGVMYGVVSRLTPPLQLLTSLAFADMLAPWAIMTLYFPASTCQEEIHIALLLTAHNACGLSLMALAFIHNIATFRPLQYERIVTQKRTWISINLIWMGALVTANLHFLATLGHQPELVGYCDQVRHNLPLSLIMAATLSGVTALVTGAIYCRILAHLRPLQAITDNDGQPRKSTKGVITGILLASTFLFGWIPIIITKFEQVKHGLNPPESILVAQGACQILVLVTCFIAPIIYGHRMTNMEMGYLRLQQRTKGWVVLQWNKLRNRHEADELPSTPLNPIESIC